LPSASIETRQFGGRWYCVRKEPRQTVGPFFCATPSATLAEGQAGDPATPLRGRYLRLTTAARAKAVSDLDEVTRVDLERAEEKVLEDARPPRDNIVTLASRRWPTPWAFSARAFTRSDRRRPRHLRHAGR